MEILYNQYYKSGARGTHYAKEKAAVVEFVENDNEHHDIGFKYETVSEANLSAQAFRTFVKRKFSGGQSSPLLKDLIQCLL